jgi:guanylate kinase
MANKIVLVGKAASGKDHLRKRLMDKGLNYGVSHTTRDPRPGEVEGKDYWFVSEEEFMQIVERGDMIEYQMFNGWYYGIASWIFEEADIMIMNAEAVNLLPEHIRSQCTVIYLDIPLEVRVSRLMERGDIQDPMARRLKADENQFAGFENYDIKITNPDF